MQDTLKIIFSLAWKDWLLFIRQPFLILISIVMPVVFVLFYAMIIPVSATTPVVIALEGEGPHSQRFLQILTEIHSQEAPYYEIVTSDPADSRNAFEMGTAFGLIVIPSDFDNNLEKGVAQVELHINNINSDYSKNLRLRLDHALGIFNDQYSGSKVHIEEKTWLPEDPLMRDYISTSLLLFACLYSTMLNTGLLIASEWNDRTIKTILLAPIKRGVIITGKILAGLGQSIFSIGLVTLFLLIVFEFHPTGSAWAMGGIILVVMLLGAGLGAIVGVGTKQTLPTTSLLIALAVVIFLVSGNEDSLRGLAWQGPILVLWQISRFLPTTYAFLAARSLFLTGDAATLGRDLIIILLTMGLTVYSATLFLQKAYSQLTGGQ